MQRKLILIIFVIITSNVITYSQLKNNSISKSLNKRVSIYEYGDSLTSCETNFRNLFRNWNKENITNATQYNEFGNYYFVETISDSAKYRYYRNYFSGLEVVNYHYTSAGSISYDEKQNIIKERVYFVAPYKHKWTLLDHVPIETMEKMLKVYNSEINIDTIHIKTVFQESIKNLKEKQDGDSSYYNTKEAKTIQVWAYSDSITKQSIDSMVLHQVRFEDLSSKSRDAIQTAEALLMRVGMQKKFNESVHIGDKVYVVPFQFGGLQYKIFVICNPISKKVVMDYFFKNIYL